ncbi:MAG: ABC transporter permease [Planctomycetota bacterium]|jgi:peptide/nickel transport system permease protein
MTAYIIRRLLYTIPVVLGVTIIVFLLFNVVGGDPTAMMVGKNPKPREVRDVRRKYDLDKPIFLNLYYLADLEDPVKDGLDTAVDLEGDGREAALADVHRFGKAAVPSLMAAFEEGSDPRRALAAEILAEYTGFVSAYPLDGKGEDAATRKGKAEGRKKSLTAWLGWWDENRAAYELSFPGRVSKIFSSQYFIFLGGALTGDFGRSFKQKQKISRMIRDGIIPSLSLSVPAFFLGVLAAIYISLLCAFYRNSWIDRGIVVLSVLGMSLSMLIYIIACQYFLAYRFNWFPVWGYESGLASIPYLLLPVVIWILVALGSDVRFFRTVILDEINQDYVRTAQAKGLSQNKVLFKHVLKNAMIPIITRLVIAIPFLYTGSLLLERFFGIPGLGNMLVEAVNNSDLFVVRAMTFIGAILYVLGNLMTDICYAVVDPRIRLG